MVPLNASSDMVVEPFFLDSPSGRLFAVHHRPRNASKIRGHVLCVPPFNEEMNRCRSMLTLQAQALAALGFGTLVFDLHGTGDSEGEYRDARWSAWLNDICAAKNWLQAQPGGGLKAIIGVRLGAILAAEATVRLGLAAVALIFWQPVLDGKIHLSQFLRVRMAAQLDRTDLPKETTATLRHQLATEQVVEVAGYEIHPELARAIDTARLLDHKLNDGVNVLWLENASPDKSEISTISMNAVNSWKSAGVNVDALAYAGPGFWQVHERVITPPLIEKTSAWFHERMPIQ